MLCTDLTLGQVFSGATTFRPLRCKSWGCSICNPMRKRRLVAEACSGNPNRLITLTVNPHTYSDQHERARKLAWAWKMVRRRLERINGGKKIEFLAVFEKTKLGEPHLHILARCEYIDQKWLSEQMADLIAAPIVDIRKVNNGKKAARYVSKYIGKDPQRFKGTKRYWSSQQYKDQKGQDDYAEQAAMSCFFVVKGGYDKILQHFKHLTPSLIETNERFTIAGDWRASTARYFEHLGRHGPP